MNLDAKALVGFIKEVEDSRARQKAETELQRDVFKRAAKKFFDGKAMRIVLQRRAMDSTLRDEQDYNVECYELALAGKKAAIEALEQGKSIREAAEAGDIAVGFAAALAKGVQESSFMNMNKPHITETAGRDIPSSESRSLALAASDSVPTAEPVEPTGNEGWVGERGTEQEAPAALEGEGCEPVFTPRMALNRLGSDDRPGAEDGVRVHRASVSTDGGASRDTGTEQPPDLCAGLSATAPQSPPQLDACSTDLDDLQPPPRLLEKRKEIEARRAAR